MFASNPEVREAPQPEGRAQNSNCFVVRIRGRITEDRGGSRHNVRRDPSPPPPGAGLPTGAGAAPDPFTAAATLLARLGLAAYEEVCRTHEFDMDALMLSSLYDLVDIGIPPHAARAIMAAVREELPLPPREPELPNLEQTPAQEPGFASGSELGSAEETGAVANASHTWSPSASSDSGADQYSDGSVYSD
jgi:hypothetical protein